MRKRKPPESLTHRFVAVVDLGEKVRYSKEVRQRASLQLPFRLSKRSSIRQLEGVYYYNATFTQ